MNIASEYTGVWYLTYKVSRASLSTWDIRWINWWSSNDS